jgi:hypothetical protein
MKTPNAKLRAVKPRQESSFAKRPAQGAAPVPWTLRMGHWEWPILAMLLLVAACAQAQTNYSIVWSTMDGGGGTSTGGVYTVSGTIGQPDAGQQTMTGGDYSLAGGFWSFLAIQTTGAPHLWVMRTTTNTVCVWWAASDTGWQLEATTNLATNGSVWTGCSHVTNGANCVYIESPPAGRKFYRLKK